MSVAKQLAYRLNLLLGRFQSLIILLLLYFLWTEVSRSTGQFAGLTSTELVSYILLVHLLRPVVFGSLSAGVADEINQGIFSTYLIKPMSHFWFCYWRELGERTVLFGAATIEVLIIAFLIKPTMPLTVAGWGLVLFFISLLIAHFLYVLLSYCIHLLAFWSREATGLRFLYYWLVEFSSGAYFPLHIVAPAALLLLKILPFNLMLYTPVMLFLGKVPADTLLSIILSQFGWLAVAVILTAVIWKRGLRRYSGEGI